MESSDTLEESLLLNLTVLCSLQRKRHYWRLDSKCLTLFQNESGSKYYKVKISYLLKICTLKYCVFSKYIQVIFISCYIGLQLLQLCLIQFLEVTVKILVKASILYPSISPLATALLPKFFLLCDSFFWPIRLLLFSFWVPSGPPYQWMSSHFI